MKWSLSSLGVFEKCQLKYKLQYIDGLSAPRGAAASRGVENHKIFEDRITGQLAALPLEYNYYEELTKEIIDKQGVPEFRVSFRRNWEPCGWSDPDVWYRGILDVYVPGDTSWVVDWKTGKIYPDHDDQKHLYSTAIMSRYDNVQRVRAEHVYIDLGKRREKTFDRSELSDMRKHWEARVKFLDLTAPEDMVPSPGYHCKWCPFNARSGGPCRF